MFYLQTEFSTFWSEFNHYLKYAMIIFKREPAVERLIDFVAKFVPALAKKSEEEGDEGNESDHDDVSDNKMLQQMFDFLLQVHLAYLVSSVSCKQCWGIVQCQQCFYKLT